MPIRSFAPDAAIKSRSLRKKTRRALTVLFLALCLISVPVFHVFRTLTGSMAVSNASDLITQRVSAIVEDKMRRLEGEGGSFVSFEKDAAGNITAIVTDTARVNILSSELLKDVVTAANAGDLNLRVPLWDLLGISLLMGRGPRIPVRITMLTSSRVEFKNVLSDAGINQTKHQLLLEVQVDADVLLPWEIRSARIITEVLVAETVIVGRVPDTYISAEKPFRTNQ
ncbi:MAG: sporulation protein YunB [Oscillospiraceae bacterium]|nr:sporulation protein YunB [Oscillospiraceae bacterium]